MWGVSVSFFDRRSCCCIAQDGLLTALLLNFAADKIVFSTNLGWWVEGLGGGLMSCSSHLTQLLSAASHLCPHQALSGNLLEALPT